jgi:hypothetical protein
LKVYLIVLASALVVMLCCGPSASANTQQFTFAGSDGDGPVSGTAIITTSNGKITIQITDLQSGMVSIGQSISELSFGISSGSASSATLDSFAGNQIGVNHSGAVSGQALDNGWGVGVSGAVITVAASGDGHFQNLSEYEILGPVCGNGKYCDANGSIAGNSAHDSLYNGTVTIVLDVTGVTSATSVNDVNMFFGTGPELELSASSSVVPEPTTLFLLGTGLCLLGGALRRRMIAAA